MTQQEIDRIECAIRHIQSSLDVDPWAMDIAVAAMKKQIPERPKKRGDKMTREEAIDVLKHNYPSACFTDLCEAVEIAIQALSAQPERKTGKWIEYDNSHCECPFCHTEWSYFENEVEHFDFCPRCGARMEAET